MADWAMHPSPSVVIPYTSNSQSSSSMNTKGAYKEVYSSIWHTGMAYITVNGADNATSYLMDIAIGAEGSETIIVNNLYVPTVQNFFHPMYYPLPIILQAGTRLSTRNQCSSASQWLDVSFNIVGNSNFGYLPGFQVCDTFGAVTGSSRGTAYDPGATADTKGSWTQITASTPRDYKGLFLAFGPNADWVREYAYWMYDIGLTSSPGNAFIISNAFIYAHQYNGPGPCQFFPINIPRGTEVHIRAQCNINVASNRTFDFVAYMLA